LQAYRTRTGAGATIVVAGDGSDEKNDRTKPNSEPKASRQTFSISNAVGLMGRAFANGKSKQRVLHLTELNLNSELTVVFDACHLL